MPFTLAHCAAVLPLLRSRHFSATALIVGSIAPDFEYFLRFKSAGDLGHSIPGLFYFDLPVSIVLAFIFHLVVKNNLILNLPIFFQKRFIDTLTFNFVRYVKQKPFIFFYSALLGSFTHLVWDSFTHGNSFFVNRLWFYKGSYVYFMGVEYPLFYALQYISTYVGLAIVFWYIFRKRSYQTEFNKPIVWYWLGISLITLLVFGLRYWIEPSDMQFGNQVVSSISGLLLALIIMGLVPFKKSTFHEASA